VNSFLLSENVIQVLKQVYSTSLLIQITDLVKVGTLSIVYKKIQILSDLTQLLKKYWYSFY